MNVAFLGLGAIGCPMATHLARRYQLTVYNRTAERARDFARQYTAGVAGSPKEAALGADVVVTCLPSSREVETLLEGGGRTPGRARPGNAVPRLHLGRSRGLPPACRPVG